MKYSNLKPGPQLGKKITEVKINIIIGKIRNKKSLKNFLQET